MNAEILRRVAYIALAVAAVCTLGTFYFDGTIPTTPEA